MSRPHDSGPGSAKVWDVPSPPRFAPLSMGYSLAGAVVIASWVIGLALAHYPPWRVVTAGALGAAITVTNVVAARTRSNSVSPWVSMAGMLAIDSVTGGLGRPFFVAGMGAFFL